jgi:putative acyl-CoA dehydrogenase
VGLSVAEGLRTVQPVDRAGEGMVRDARMFLMAQLEPSHLTPVSTTAAAALGLADDPVDLWGRLASTRLYDPRPIGAPEKSGVMIGVGFTAGKGDGVRVTRAGQSYVHRVTGTALVTNAGPYDGILVPVDGADGRRTTFLVPMRSESGGPNGVTVSRVFGRGASSSAAFAEITFTDSTGWRVGEFGGSSEVMAAPIERLRVDSVLSAAGRMRKAVSWAAFHANEEALIEDPVVARLIASSEVQTEVAVLMLSRMSALFERSVGPDRSFERLLLTLTQHWTSTRTERVMSTARQVAAEAGFPLPREMAWDPPLVAMWAKAEVALAGDLQDLIVNDAGVIDALEVEVEVLRRAGGRFADVHSWLTTTLRNAPRGRVPWPGVLESASLLWGAALLVRHDRHDVATAMLRMHLGGLSDLLFGSRSMGSAVRAVADKAVPEGNQVWFGEAKQRFDILIDLRDIDTADIGPRSRPRVP